MIVNMQCSITLKNFDLDDKEARRKIEDALPDFRFDVFAPPVVPLRGFPRMIGSSEYGHASLRLGDTFAHLIMQYDENYQDDWNKCFDYAHKRIGELREALQSVEATFQFGGIVIQYVMDDFPEPVTTLSESVSKVSVGERKLTHLQIKFSFPYRENYYINVEMEPVQNEATSANALGITIDVNNRLAKQRSDAPRVVDWEDLVKIEEILSGIKSSTLHQLVEKGEFAI